jgi:hypothetical protein
MSAIRLHVISDTRTTSGIEHPQQAQLTFTRILDTQGCQAKSFNLN